MNRAGNAEGDWKVTELCIHCKLPIAQWDTGRWVHLRMGQLECHFYYQNGNQATPPNSNQGDTNERDRADR